MGNPYDTVKERTSILGPTIHFKGELTADEDLVIHGRIEGSIVHTQRLTIGPQGRVQADVQAQLVIVEGTIDGNIRAGKSVAVREGANVKGDIAAPSVSILEGAHFNGHVDMNKDQAADLDATVVARTHSGY